MSEVLLGRQPVLDRDEGLFGYELLCRSESDVRGDALDGDQRSATVVLNAFIEIGLDEVVGGCPVFVRMTPRFLTDGLYRPLPHKRVILSLGIDDDIDEGAITALTEARRLGYRVALERFLDRPTTRPLLADVDFARVDATSNDAAIVAAQAQPILDAGAIPIATRVETKESVTAALDAGFRFFQGYHFCRPDVLRARSVAAHRVPVLELLARIHDPNVDLRDVTRIVEHEPTLAYRLLRAVNSAMFGLPRKIESIRHAIAMLGIERVRDCLSLVLLVEVDDKPSALTTTSLVRARTCQLLGRALGVSNEEVFFTAGLLSVLDAMLDQPMEEALGLIPISTELREAIETHIGDVGFALDAALSCEENRPASVAAFTRFGFRAIRIAHLTAIKWARQLETAIA